ncbi:MAG: hypothetical protein OXG24_06990 [Gammaproteobacteria bacterium]|nr:hypothetical protein [Gammaproteobacteria bacterium]
MSLEDKAVMIKHRSRRHLRLVAFAFGLGIAFLSGSIVADGRFGNSHNFDYSIHVGWNVDDPRTDIELLDGGLIAVLTTEGIFEFSSANREPTFHAFKTRYRGGVQFVRIDSELHVLGMKDEDNFWGFSNDIHLLKYGESSPERVWRCGSCTSPQVVNYYDSDRPLLVFASTARGNQELRLVQLGGNEEWRVDAAGYNLEITPKNIHGSNTGLQDVCIHMTRDRRHYPGSHHPMSVWLSEIDFSQKRSHITDFGRNSNSHSS